MPPALVQDCDAVAARDPWIYCRAYLQLHRSSLLSNGHLHKVWSTLTFAIHLLTGRGETLSKCRLMPAMTRTRYPL